MKRFSLIFAAVLLASAVVSCGGGEAITTPETTAAVTGGESTVETEEVFDPFANLPEKDYEGFDTALSRRNTLYVIYEKSG